jgi:hypothetical protein
MSADEARLSSMAIVRFCVEYRSVNQG